VCRRGWCGGGGIDGTHREQEGSRWWRGGRPHKELRAVAAATVVGGGSGSGGGGSSGSGGEGGGVAAAVASNCQPGGRGGVRRPHSKWGGTRPPVDLLRGR